MPTFKGYSIDVHEVGRKGREKIALKTLAERVTHYDYYGLGYLLEMTPSKTQYVRIMSDRDKKEGLYIREFRLLDLIDVAKKVVKQGLSIVSEYREKHRRKRIENHLANRKQIEEILSPQTPQKSKAQIGKRRFEVLILEHTPDLTSSEIADQLGVSESTIRRDRVVIRESETQINRVLYQLQ